MGLAAQAQDAVQAAPDHGPLLASSEPRLAGNKRLVYECWREVFEAGHLALAEKYLGPLHPAQPSVGTGRDAFVAFFSKIREPRL